jgi:hypothetical protein
VERGILWSVGCPFWFAHVFIILPQDITLVRVKMPPLVRSGDAGKREPQGARAIAKGMLGQMTAPLDPVLPFDDAWIQEIKVCTDLAQ